MRDLCGDRMEVPGDAAYQCDRRTGHRKKHRMKFYGFDGMRYRATMKWRRQDG